jgi:glutamine cyclotransferase
MPILVLLIAALAAGASLLTPSVPSGPPVQPVKVVHTYPHDQTSFCQGLVVHNGKILEGTGHYNQSRLRSVDLLTGKPDLDIALPADVFGEGVTVWENTIIQLTWKNGYLITYDATTFERTGTVALKQIDASLREGWGITHNGQHLIISDGSSVLRMVDPKTWRVVRRLHVKNGFRSVGQLNELEFVNGEIFANVWYKDQIARIDPETGRVTSWLELAPLRPPELARSREAVLNGIAWDAVGKRLFVTGKNWPTLYEVSF